MSILQVVETSPSRVRGLVRYLSAITTQRERADTLKALLSPATLPLRRNTRASDDEEPEPGDERRAAGGMIDKVLSGCQRMGLIVAEEDRIALNPDLPVEARVTGRADARLPLTVAELVFSPSNAENHDLARLIAWYLTQDPLDPPYNEKTVIAALRMYPALDGMFGLKNQSYGQFEDWVVFLGFAWAHQGRPPERKRAITPDPTAYLRRILPSIAADAGSASLSATDFVRRCGVLCPVLEGGRFRQEVEGLGDIRREASHLSAATSQAWLRLEEEGLLSLVSQSDAASFVVLGDGNRHRQVAEVHLRRAQPVRNLEVA